MIYGRPYVMLTRLRQLLRLRVLNKQKRSQSQKKTNLFIETTMGEEESEAAVATPVAPATKEEEEKGVSEQESTVGKKRKIAGDEKHQESQKEDVVDTTTATATATATNTTKEQQQPAGIKVKIAMPPSVSSSLTDVDKYTLECAPPSDNTNEKDAATKIVTPNLMLFGLHPLVKESPFQKLLEDYGRVKQVTVRSAFASRYGHVSFDTIEEARKCYTALNGAKLLHKTFLVQPSAAPAVAAGSSSSANK